MYSLSSDIRPLDDVNRHRLQCILSRKMSITLATEPENSVIGKSDNKMPSFSEIETGTFIIERAPIPPRGLGQSKEKLPTSSTSSTGLKSYADADVIIVTKETIRPIEKYSEMKSTKSFIVPHATKGNSTIIIGELESCDTTSLPILCSRVLVS